MIQALLLLWALATPPLGVAAGLRSNLRRRPPPGVDLSAFDAFAAAADAVASLPYSDTGVRNREALTFVPLYRLILKKRKRKKEKVTWDRVCVLVTEDL